MRLNEFTHDMKQAALSFNRYIAKDDEMRGVEMEFAEWFEQFSEFLDGVYENDEY